MSRNEWTESTFTHQGDTITVWKAVTPQEPYDAYYRNKDTRLLDQLFGMPDILPVEKGSQLYKEIFRACQPGSLGDIRVDLLLNYFVYMAAMLGTFVGFSEQRLRENTRTGIVPDLDERLIDVALQHRDQMYGGVSYLKRESIEGEDILFPANLRKVNDSTLFELLKRYRFSEGQKARQN